MGRLTAAEWNPLPCACYGVPKGLKLTIEKYASLHIKFNKETFCPCILPHNLLAVFDKVYAASHAPLILLHTAHPLSILLLPKVPYFVFPCRTVHTIRELLTTLGAAFYLFNTARVRSVIVLSHLFRPSDNSYLQQEMASYNPICGLHGKGVCVVTDLQHEGVHAPTLAVLESKGIRTTSVPSVAKPWYSKELLVI